MTGILVSLIYNPFTKCGVGILSVIVLYNYLGFTRVLFSIIVLLKTKMIRFLVLLVVPYIFQNQKIGIVVHISMPYLYFCCCTSIYGQSDTVLFCSDYFAVHFPTKIMFVHMSNTMLSTCRERNLDHCSSVCALHFSTKSHTFLFQLLCCPFIPKTWPISWWKPKNWIFCKLMSIYSSIRQWSSTGPAM